ncbi:MAG: DUF4147 domain-containing protein [Parvularculaceae bacterium]
MTLAEAKRLLQRIVDSVQAAIDPAELLRPHLRALKARPYVVLGAGKASPAMARACAEELPQARGLVVAQHAAPGAAEIRILAGAHPVPDDSSVAAAQEVLDLCRSTRSDDEILFVLSGGASSLMAMPANGVALAEKQALTRRLLASGAGIHEINTVRKHLSGIKGGRLSAATRARVRTFALSDLPGDDPAAIGSGPTVPDTSTLDEAREILERWNIAASPTVAAALADPRNETLKQEPSGLLRIFTLIGGPATAIEACRTSVEVEGYRPIVLGALSGEAKSVARGHAELARSHAASGERVALISGGELSVDLGEAAGGAGGRCREYLLALAVALGPRIGGVCAAAWDTDGIDGAGDDAGAFLFADSLDRASRIGMNVQDFLRAHRSGDFFSALGDAMEIGAQTTNVGDMRVVLVESVA